MKTEEESNGEKTHYKSIKKAKLSQVCEFNQATVLESTKCVLVSYETN